MICALAEHLGRGSYFTYASPRDVFDELRRASAGGTADYSGITYEKIEANTGVFWPCPAEDDTGGAPGTPRACSPNVLPRPAAWPSSTPCAINRQRRSRTPLIRFT